MTRVLLWDEDSFVLATMRAALSGQSGIDVIEEDARTVDDMRRLVELHQPDVLVMNALLPDANIFDVIREVSAMPNPPGILISSTFGQAQVVRRMLDVGATGYLLRCEEVPFIFDAVREVAKGCRWLSPKMDRQMKEWFASATPTVSGLAALTLRELEVLELLARGSNNAEIADRLSLTVGTVKNHITNIYGKLGVYNERAAIAFAWRTGLMDHLLIEK